MNWILAIIATVISYTLFSYFGMRVGEADSFKDAALAPFTSIVDFALVLFGSCGFGIATYYALKSSAYAIPIIISLGLLVSFVFSVLFADGKISSSKLIGFCIIILGVLIVK